MFFHKREADVESHFVVRMARRFLPLSRDATSERFTVRESGRLNFTLLFLVLIVIEVTDFVFALDSIPAIFGVTTDPFIVYTSNICAVLGLRSLYFLLARAVRSLIYLQIGLAFVLVFIGGKMLVKALVPITTSQSLMVVGSILGVTIVASLVKSAFDRKEHPAHP
jgi:tellurite resistance protein TerC